LTQIDHFAKSRHARKVERKQHAAADLAYILNASYKNTLLSTFLKLRISSHKIYQTRKNLKRMTLRALNRRMNSAFGIWKKNHKKAKIAYEINTEGDIAVEAERTKRRVNILKK